MADQNKRNLTRIDFHSRIEIFLRNKKIAETKTENLSIKGVLVKSSELKKGDACRVVVNLSGNRETPRLEVDGVVVRVNEPDEAAIFFQKMDLETFNHLKNIISMNDGDPDKIQQEFLDHIKARLV